MGNVPTTRRKGGSKELEKFCKPTGLYETCPWEERVVRRWIMDGQVAPRFPGVDAPSYGTVADHGMVPGAATGLDVGGGRGGVVGPAVPQQVVQTEECPICFMHYEGVNTTVCCSKPLCTECYLQVRPPRSSVVCPFCNCAKFAVAYLGPPSREESERRMAEEQRTIEARIHAEQEERMRQAKSRAALESTLASGAGSLGSAADGAGRPAEYAFVSSSSSARPYDFASSSSSTSTSTSSSLRPPARVSLATVAERRLTEERIRNQIVHLPSASNSLSTPSTTSMGNSGAIPFESGLQRHRQPSRARGSRTSRRSALPFDSEDESTGDFQEQVEGLGGAGEQGDIQQVEDLMLMEALRLSVLEEQARRERSGDMMRRQVAEAAAASSSSSSAASVSTSSGFTGQASGRASGQTGAGTASSEPGPVSSRFLSAYMDRPVHRPQRPVHRSVGEAGASPLGPTATPGATSNDSTSALGGGFGRLPMLWETGALLRPSEDNRDSGPIATDTEDRTDGAMGLAGQSRSTEATELVGEASRSGTPTANLNAGGQLLSLQRMTASMDPLVVERSRDLSGGALGDGKGPVSSGKSGDVREGDAGVGAEYCSSELPDSEEEQLKLAIALSLRSGTQESERDAARGGGAGAAGAAVGTNSPTGSRPSEGAGNGRAAARTAARTATPVVDSETMEKVVASLAAKGSFAPLSPTRAFWAKPHEDNPIYDRKTNEAFRVMRAATALLEAAEEDERKAMTQLVARPMGASAPRRGAAIGEGARAGTTDDEPFRPDDLLDWFSREHLRSRDGKEATNEAMPNSKLPAPDTPKGISPEENVVNVGVSDDAGGEEVKVSVAEDVLPVASGFSNVDVSQGSTFDDLTGEGPEEFSVSPTLAPAGLEAEGNTTGSGDPEGLEPAQDTAAAVSHESRGVDSDPQSSSMHLEFPPRASMEEEDLVEVATPAIDDTVDRNLDALLIAGGHASGGGSQGSVAVNREPDMGGGELEPSLGEAAGNNPSSLLSEQQEGDSLLDERDRETGDITGSFVESMAVGSTAVGAAVERSEGSQVNLPGLTVEGPDGAAVRDDSDEVEVRSAQDAEGAPRATS